MTLYLARQARRLQSPMLKIDSRSWLVSACLSLGQKAGAIVSGYMSLRQAFAQARVLYMIMAEDIAIGRAQEYHAWCTQHGVPYVTLFTKEDLGHIIGKPSRSAVGLTAPRFLELLLARLTSLERLQTAYDGA